MRKYVFILSLLGVGMVIFGCAKKKEASLEQMQEPLSSEVLGAISATTAPIIVPDPGIKDVVAPTISLTEAQFEPLPPEVNKPTIDQIQAALKNAGFYTGNLDGKKGPLTKKAIEEFQKNNSLEVDGKVGPKTWGALSKYLNALPAEAPRKSRR